MTVMCTPCVIDTQSQIRKTPHQRVILLLAEAVVNKGVGHNVQWDRHTAENKG